MKLQYMQSTQFTLMPEIFTSQSKSTLKDLNSTSGQTFQLDVLVGSQVPVLDRTQNVGSSASPMQYQSFIKTLLLDVGYYNSHKDVQQTTEIFLSRSSI